jgi:ATP-dependent DNA helicase PIF1
LPALPPHLLKLKVGAPVILLRNLNPAAGLCNGTRTPVGQCGQRVVECEILSGKYAGHRTFLLRIALSFPSDVDLPFDFQRTQFPLRLVYSIDNQ